MFFLAQTGEGSFPFVWCVFLLGFVVVDMKGLRLR